MQKEKLNSAFQEIKCSEDFAERVIHKCETAHRRKQPYRKVLLAASCLVLFILTGTYVGAKYYGGLEKLFGNDTAAYEECIQKDDGLITGDNFEMQVKECMCMKNAAQLIVEVKGLTEKGQELLDEEQVHVMCNFELENLEEGTGGGGESYRDDTIYGKELDAAYFIFKQSMDCDLTKYKGTGKIKVELSCEEEHLETSVVMEKFTEDREITLEQNDNAKDVVFTKMVITPLTFEFTYICNKEGVSAENFPFPEVQIVMDGEVKDVQHNNDPMTWVQDEYYMYGGSCSAQLGGTEQEPESYLVTGSSQNAETSLSRILDLDKLEAVIVDGERYEFD